MALFSKVLSRATVRHCHSGAPRLAVEELKKRHGFGPWLVYADAENDETGGKGVRRCYSLSSGEAFSLPAPQLQGRRCWGTRFGWLVTFTPSNGDVHLLNPLTHSQLPLPRRRYEKFAGFSLSSHPADPDDRLVVMSIYSSVYQLTFSSPGDEAWKFMKNESRSAAYTDTIFYRGQFYAIDCRGNLKVWDITNSDRPRDKLITTFYVQKPCWGFYLVEISGHLHLIQRAYVPGPYVSDGVKKTIKTKGFDIYRFDFQQTNKWISIDHLDGHAVFVGNNTTFAVSAIDYPEVNPDCIYFTDANATDYKHTLCDYKNPLCDMGVYDFATKALVHPVPFIKQDNSPYSTISRPFFFIPSLSDL